MRILVIGGTRFIGPYVVRRLHEHGHDIAVFYRGVHTAELPLAVTNIRDPRAQLPVTCIPPQLRAYSPDVVLHMIAMGERDADAAREAFVNVAGRIVVLSSGDVYRAYGVFKRIESGPLEPLPLHESAPLRSRLYPYRQQDTPAESLEYYYDKVLVERAIAADARLPATILRLPKVYGPGDNEDLSSIYAFRSQPQWRWTHGFVANVADAIVAAVERDRASGRTYNVGEQYTPTMGERLRELPLKSHQAPPDHGENFDQDIVYDTSAIRTELGYSEQVPEPEAMRSTASAAQR